MWERQILPILQIFLLWVNSGQNSVLFQAALSIRALREEQGCRASRACLDKLQWMLNNCLGAARAFNFINIHCGNVRGDLRIIIIWNTLYKCLAKQSSLESQWGAHARRRCREFSSIPCGLKLQKTSACPLAPSKGGRCCSSTGKCISIHLMMAEWSSGGDQSWICWIEVATLSFSCLECCSSRE